MKARLEKKLKNAVARGVTTLNLGSCNLREVPKHVFDMANLRTLTLCFNQITELPPELGQLTHIIDAVKGQEIILQLYCQAPGCWHPTDASGRYIVRRRPSWLTKAAPYIRSLLKIIKVATPFGGPIAGIIDDEMIETMKHEVELMEAIAKALPEKEIAEAPRFASDVTEKSVLEETAGAFLRVIRNLLDEVVHPKSGVVWARC